MICHIAPHAANEPNFVMGKFISKVKKVNRCSVQGDANTKTNGRKEMKPGKQFEKDFEQSCKKTMPYIRFNDPASSFNTECNGCPKKKTRFAASHLCDAVAYSYPNMFLFELKSVQGKSIPFKNIVKNERDNRLNKMVECGHEDGVESFVVINFRAVNKTYAMYAFLVKEYIEMVSNRASIPILHCERMGFLIDQKLKRVHYGYDIEGFVEKLTV